MLELIGAVFKRRRLNAGTEAMPMPMLTITSYPENAVGKAA